MKGCKICGISDLDTLNFTINHPYPPQFIGFICNYKKSSRYVDVEKLNELLAIDKKKSNFVAVLVKPDEDILEKIKHLPFDYYQIYDSTPDEIKEIKQKYDKKIITALIIKDETDVQKYHSFSDVTDIFLFDSNVAARIGRDAFLDPEILMCPLSFAAPKTSNFFMIILLVKLLQFDPCIFLYGQRMKFQETDLLLEIKIEQHLHLHKFLQVVVWY